MPSSHTDIKWNNKSWEKYLFFIDESGDHSLQNINDDFPYFLLCWVLISESEYDNLCQKIESLKIEFFGTTQAILHSRDIRKCEWHFSRLFDLDLKAKFYDALNTIISETDFIIISNTVHKNDYIKLYGKTAINPYHISLSYILERMIFALDGYSSSGVDIYIEKRGKREDALLLNHYNSVLDTGTYYVTPERFRSHIHDCHFRSKLSNDIGIQLADLCAYPIISAIRSDDYQNPAYMIVDPKIYKNPKTWHKSWLKVIP